MKRRFRATVAYDGSAYQGFQRQIGNTPTIQLVLENTLEAVTGQQVRVHGAGRTDTGVHAAGQVIAFDVEWSHPEEALLRALNINLPDDIALQEIALAAPNFHPRFAADARLYRYTVVQARYRQPLLRQQAWVLNFTLDVEAMRQGAALLLGEHDFGAFGKSPDGGHTIRTVHLSEWQQQQQRLIYTVKANAFLQHMVRRIVGTLVDVGRGRLTLAKFEEIMRQADPSKYKTLAPPQGLVLEAVFYPPEKLIE